MKFAHLNGVQLGYRDVGDGEKVAILLHGWGCNHSFFAPQETHLLSLGYRVISIDLRGHGSSEAPPDCDYAMELFASDVTTLAAHLGISKAVVIGHSMGGLVALQVAASGSLASSVVLVDSVVLPDPAIIEALEQLISLMERPEYRSLYGPFFENFLLPTDDDSLRVLLRAQAPFAPQHVLVSALRAHLDQDAVARSASACQVPTAYLGNATPIANLEAFKQRTPQLMTAKTLGSGHFSPLQVPEQINAMLTTFLRLSEAA